MWGTTVNLTQIIAIVLAVRDHGGASPFPTADELGTAMRALANDREITATLGVPVRRVEAAAWFGSGIVCGAAGLLLPDLSTSLDVSALTFLVISALAAALIGRLESLWVDACSVGSPSGSSRPSSRHTAHAYHPVGVPSGGTVRACDRRAPLPVAATRRLHLTDGAVALDERRSDTGRRDDRPP